MKVVTLLSGGLDSTALLYYLGFEGAQDLQITALSFDYGQRHGRWELAAATQVVRHFQSTRPHPLDHHIIDMRGLGMLLDGSALTDRDVPVPEGHYTHESMKATVVPNRNMVMLSIATSIAVAQNAQMVAFGAHAGDHAIYPDCRDTFVTALEGAILSGNHGFLNPRFQLTVPFITCSKTEIVKYGAVYGAPFELTYSCYKGSPLHCGRCATCIERREAFDLASVADPTAYADDRPWRDVLAEVSHGDK